jgi:hypothetical protein
VLGYSVLFPPLAAALSPQLVAAIAATATAALFEPLARHRYGSDGWLGALWFGLAVAGTNLFTGRLTFAFGMLPAVGCALALQRRRPALATVLAIATALASPVAALFAALAGAAAATAAYITHRSVRATVPGLATAACALGPVAILAVAFPEGGSEPFLFTTLFPIPLIALVLVLASDSRDWALKAGAVLYALACLVTYALTTPVGSNAARLAPLVAGPVMALVLWPRRKLLLLILAVPLLYIQWQAPIRDVSTSVGDPSASASYWRPLLAFLTRQPGQPFRIEIPFTQFHYEAYEIAPRFPLARGWERQLDIEDNALFYDGTLSASTYHAWLKSLGIRFVAVSDASLDYSARAEERLIRRGLPYLTPVLKTRHWRVYAVEDATPLAEGAATATAIGPNWLTLTASHSGTSFLRVRFTPYWSLNDGCVGPENGFTKLTLRHAGPVRLTIKFDPARIGAHSPRCSP